MRVSFICGRLLSVALLGGMMVAIPAIGHAEEAPKTEASCPQERLTLAISGMTCDFCVRTIETLFNQQDEVSGTQVMLEDGKANLLMKPGKTLSDEKIQELMAPTGYKLTGIERGC